jgi:hypothetical protein
LGEPVLPEPRQPDLDPTNLVWDTSKFRWEFSNAGPIIAPSNAARNCLIFRYFQAGNTSASTASDAVCVYQGSGNAVLFDSCLLRGGKNVVYVAGSQGRHVFHDCVLYGGAAAGAAVLNAGTVAAVVARNCTAIGGAYGLRSNGGAWCLAENSYFSGTTAGLNATGGGTIAANTCASSDATASTGTGVAASGTPLTNVARSTATFRNVTAGSEDFRLAVGSPLAYAGADLSPGRRRYFADCSSASESTTGGAPVGVLAFETGSSVATFRLWNSVADKWYDGTDSPYNLSLSIPLPHASTTSDWVAFVADTHFGDVLKATAGPGIDALNAGAKGRWNRATAGAWVNNGFPCAGRLKHLFVLGDIGPSDMNQFGTGAASAGDLTATGHGQYAQYQENLWNTSGLASPPGAAVQSIPHANTWHLVGNHDTTDAMASICNLSAGVGGNGQAACHTELGGFESYRLNQHGRANSGYTGATYADIDELHQLADVGNHRFVLLNFYGSDSGITHANRWTPADTTWAKWALSTLPAGSNLFLLPHAPPTQSSRYSHSDQPLDTEWEVAASLTPWAAAFSGHCHNFAPAGSGPDWASVATRDDFPARAVPSWDIGAHESPARAAARAVGLRHAGRAVRTLS